MKQACHRRWSWSYRRCRCFDGMLVLVNYDNATAAEVHAVIEHVQDEVKRRFDVGYGKVPRRVTARTTVLTRPSHVLHGTAASQQIATITPQKTRSPSAAIGFSMPATRGRRYVKAASVTLK